MIGEVLVTCEKLTWLADHGSQYLQREYRDTGRMMMMKRVYVDYIPLGKILTISSYAMRTYSLMQVLLGPLYHGTIRSTISLILFQLLSSLVIQ